MTIQTSSLIALIANVVLSSANANANDGVDFKLTSSVYSMSISGHSTDINLRAHKGNDSGQQTTWIGFYRSSQGFNQTRVGYEYLLLQEYFRTTFSSQLASGGFVGGSITSEVGPKNVFGLLGFGRTNLQPYVNLNFDPNDMIQFGLGWRPDRLKGHHVFSLYRTQDNRLNTGQAITHLVWRDAYSEGHRFSVDAFHKRGEIDTGATIRNKVGVGVGYENGPWGIRLAYDPYVNFTSERMLRLNGTFRF
jgi:hypothetical protein